MLETSQAQSVIFTMQSSSAGHQRLVSSTLSSTSSYRRDAFDGQIIQTQPGQPTCCTQSAPSCTARVPSLDSLQARSSWVGTPEESLPVPVKQAH